MILVGNGLAIRAVYVETGVVRKAGAAEIKRAFSHFDPPASALAIDLARELKFDGDRRAAREAARRASTPLRVRVRAAAALASARTCAGRTCSSRRRRLRGRVGSTRPTTSSRSTHLSAVLGRDADPVAQGRDAGESAEGWSAAMNGFVALGEPAVPALARDADRGGAVQRLSRRRGARAREDRVRRLDRGASSRRSPIPRSTSRTRRQTRRSRWGRRDREGTGDAARPTTTQDGRLSRTSRT